MSSNFSSLPFLLQSSRKFSLRNSVLEWLSEGGSSLTPPGSWTISVFLWSPKLMARIRLYCIVPSGIILHTLRLAWFIEIKIVDTKFPERRTPFSNTRAQLLRPGSCQSVILQHCAGSICLPSWLLRANQIPCQINFITVTSGLKIFYSLGSPRSRSRDGY